MKHITSSASHKGSGISRLKSALVWMIIISMLASVMTVTVSAASEKEPNDSYSAATAISVNTPVDGALSKSSDVDWYKFTVSERGYINIDFTHDLIDSSSTYWDVRVYNSTGVNTVDGSSSQFIVRGNANMLSSTIGIAPGTYYIKVTSNYYSSNPYVIKVNFTPTDAWEIESNSNKNNATELSTNKEYGASLSSSGESDWFKFTVSESGYFNVDFKHELIDSTNTYWEIRFYDFTAVNFIDGNNDKYSVAGNQNVKTADVGVAPGTYYIKINSNYYSNMDYSLKINFTPSSEWESEDNGSKEKADELDVNKTYHGSLGTNGDVDWYKFTVSESGFFNVEFTHELTNSTYSFWEIRLYDFTGVNFIDGDNDKYSVTGNANLTTANFGVPAGTYYIKISRNYSLLQTYDIKINFTPSTEWETENNSDIPNADEIRINMPINGANGTVGDQDWYKIVLNNSCDFAVSFSHDFVNSSDAMWEISLYDATGTQRLLFQRSAGNNPAMTTEYIQLNAGTYYIKINPNYFSTASYTLTAIERHDCKGEFSVTKAPTCTDAGVEERLCTVCGKSLETKAVPAKGHTSDNWIIDVQPTCNSEGKKHGECTVCGYTTVEAVEKLSHKFGGWSERRASKCEADGVEERICELCGAIEERAIEALGHKYDEWKTVSGNMVIPPIIREHRCELCGETESIRDWGYVWVTVLAGIAAIGLCAGVVAYFKAYKNP